MVAVDEIVRDDEIIFHEEKILFLFHLTKFLRGLCINLGLIT